MTTAQQDIHYDIIIIGAGASGMSLTLALQDQGYTGKVLVLEGNDALHDSKIWSFWDLQNLPNYIYPLIDYKWHEWSSSIGVKDSLQSTLQSPYCSIRAESLNQAFLANVSAVSEAANLSGGSGVSEVSGVAGVLGVSEVADHNNIFLMTSQTVTDIHEKSDYVVVTARTAQSNAQSNSESKTQSTEQFTARRLVDTRPKQMPLPNYGLWQSFYGIEIRTQSAVFSSATVKLMDQLNYQNEGIEFFYILPFSRNHALIECTYFTQKNMSHSMLKAKCIAYIDKRLNGMPYAIFREEKGQLPMFNQVPIIPSHKQQRIIQGGMTAGALRASTGYSFNSIQQWASRTAQMITHEEPLRTFIPIKFYYRLMDNLMLKVVNENMQTSPELFLTLSQSISGDRFARFMSEQATLLDLLLVIYAMPKRSFLRALFSRW